MSRLAVAALALAIAAPLHAAPRAFSVQDLVMFDRVSEAALSPDGRRVVLQLRETDYAANKGKSSLWTLPAAGGKATRLRDGANTPRWSHDGAAIWFLAAKDEVQQIWRMPAAGGEAEAISALPLDVGSYKLSPDGSRIAFTAEIFIDCSDDASPLACTTQRLDKPEDAKASGLLYDRLFVRHWDT